MNIALFASAFHPHFGGVEELVRQLAHELQRRGHGVIVLTNRWPRNLAEFEEFEGLPVYRLPFRTSEESLKSKITYRLTHERICAQTLRILDRHAIDVLHVQCVSSNAHYALRARALQPRPLVVTLQGELTMDASRLFERSEGARATLRRALREADIVTGCSTKTIRDAEQFLGEPLPNARTIFNAANLDDFAQAKPWTHPRPYIFALGRLVPQKGFDLLIEAFADAALPAHDLLIAGEGPERASLERLIQSRGLAGRVHLLGRAERPKVASLFLGCSFFALPSRADEGLPVVCAEAMAAGKAIVAARAGGTPEAVLDGESGIIFEKEDRPALVAALCQLAGDPALRERFGAAGAQRAPQFSWPSITEQYVAAYHDAAGMAERPSPLPTLAST
jgi:glycogen(starch) synthase